MNRKHLYHLPRLTIQEVTSGRKDDPGKKKDPAINIKRLEAPKLRRYIDNRIPIDSSASQVLVIAQNLVSEVCQTPPLDAQTSADSEMQLRSNCITAFLAHILFWSDGANGVIILNVQFSDYSRFHQDALRLEIFNIGLEVIYNPSKILKGFEPRINWYYSIFRWVRRIYESKVIDSLRTLDKGYKRTNLGLLKRNSDHLQESKDRSSENNLYCPKNVTEALEFAGEMGDRLTGLKLLHHCFIEIKISQDKSDNFDTQHPKPEHCQHLLDRYRERSRSAGVNFEIDDKEQVQQLIEYIGKNLRKYKYLKTVPFDKEGDEEIINGAEQQADPKQTEVHEDLENNEIRDLAFQLLDKHEIDRQLLLFLYGLRMTQEDAGIEFDCHQTTIGRRNGKLSKLLGKLAKQLQVIDPHSSSYQCSSSKIIEEYINYFEFICKNYYYPDLLSRILTEIKESALSDSNIERLFIDRLETQWQFKFKPDGVGLSKVAEFVQRRTNQP